MEEKSLSQTLRSPSKNKSLSENGPAIRAIFYVQSELISKVHLELAPFFSYSIQGSCTQELRQSIEQWLSSYLVRSSSFLDPQLIKLPSRPFQNTLLKAISKIPLGQTQSYCDLALQSGYPRAARAVGSVCKKNPYPLLIPCHRVLPLSKKLGNYNGGFEIKKRLLTFEGAFFKENT